MFRSHLAHRAVRLLGAVAVTSVLSAGVLATSPAAADTSSSSKQSRVSAGSGYNYGTANGLRVHLNSRANGL